MDSLRSGTICSVTGEVDCYNYLDGLCTLKRRLNLTERREACKRLKHCPKTELAVKEVERLRGVISRIHGEVRGVGI